jgi:hypothetical protein
LEDVLVEVGLQVLVSVINAQLLEVTEISFSSCKSPSLQNLKRYLLVKRTNIFKAKDIQNTDVTLANALFPQQRLIDAENNPVKLQLINN